LSLTVHEDGKVEFATGELAFDNVDGIAETASGAGLFCDQLVSDHLVGEHLGFGGPDEYQQSEYVLTRYKEIDSRVNNTNTSLQAVVKGTLSSTTGKNLSLDDHVIST
jgi:hypothetical protein